MTTSTALAVRQDHFEYDMMIVVAGFLVGYSGNTRLAYQQDISVFGSWCDRHNLGVMDVRRSHLELFARSQEAAGMAKATIARRLSTMTSFYRYCVEEELIVRSPALNVRRPKLRQESTMSGLDRNELGAFLIEAGLSGGRDHALACLLGLNGLRISEALGADITAEAGVPALTPHAARHSFASIALSQGVAAKVVQERFGHSSIAITLDRYSHLVDGMDRDAAEVVSALIH